MLVSEPLSTIPVSLDGAEQPEQLLAVCVRVVEVDPGALAQYGEPLDRVGSAGVRNPLRRVQTATQPSMAMS